MIDSADGVIARGIIAIGHRQQSGYAASDHDGSKYRSEYSSGVRMKFFAMLPTVMLRFCAGAILLLALQAYHVRAQVVNPDTPDASQSGNQREKDTDSPWMVQQKKELSKKRNVARQQDIKKDTDKLLELATELKQYVDKTNEDILSMDVIKKADEIEKLAHSVREKMKGM